MSRFLITTMPATGHVMPMLPLVRELSARGHELHWYTGAAYRDRVLSVGATHHPIRSAEDAERGHAALRDLFYFDLVARGIWFAKRGMFALSIALGEGDSDKLVDAVGEFADTRAPLFDGIGA